MSELDLPGPTRRKVACGRCGQVVRDGREVMADGVPLCVPCSRGAYFEEVCEIPLSQLRELPTQPDLLDDTLQAWRMEPNTGVRH